MDLTCDGPGAGNGPEVTGVTVDPSPAPVGTSVTLTATATSADDTQIAFADWIVKDADREVASGSMGTGGGGFGSSTEALIANPGRFDDVGVYEVCVTATDAEHRTSEPACTLLVVYDPSAGFVTGGGWFDSPEGALVADDDLAGRASFGFVARYQRNGTVPVGNTQFQLQAGGLNFRSTSYDWLLVNQGGSNAQFKGEGRLNGVDEFTFMVWASDGGRNGADTFRIRITGPDGGLVYDNSGSELGGGSIVVHTPRCNMR